MHETSQQVWSDNNGTGAGINGWHSLNIDCKCGGRHIYSNHINIEGRASPRLGSQCKNWHWNWHMVTTYHYFAFAADMAYLLKYICWWKRKGSVRSVLCYSWRHAVTRRTVAHTTNLNSVQAIQYSQDRAGYAILTVPHWQSGRSLYRKSVCSTVAAFAAFWKRVPTDRAVIFCQLCK